jgi:hypothetical protein
VASFEPNLENKSQSVKAIKNFIREFQELLASLFPLESSEDKQLNNEEIDTFITRVLYEKEMQLVDEPLKNGQFNQRHRSLSFLRPEHLELDPAQISVDRLATAVAEIERMARVKVPKDKLVCLVNACKIIGGLLTFGAQNDGYGADDFLPTLIFTLVHSKISNVYSEIEFLK